MADEAKPPQVTRAQALIDKLWNDKSATGVSVRKAAKEMFPDINIPEDQTELAVAPVRQEVDEMKTQLKSALDKLAAREKADDDMRVENDLAVKINSAVTEFGLTDSGKTKMMERMRSTGNVSDAQAAAAWVVSQLPKPEPANSPSWMPEAANFYGTQAKDDKFESLHRNPIKFFDDELKEFYRDKDKYVAETFGSAN